MDSQFNEHGGSSAFGSAGSTGHFDPVLYIKKPHVILRLFSLLFSIVVFGCLFSQGDEKGVCFFNQDSGACNYGEAIGIMAFIILFVFLGIDALYDTWSNTQHRKVSALADIAASGLMSFLWFVCFCYLANAWRLTPAKQEKNKSAMEAVIAFSFFSIGTFIAITILAVLRYRQIVSIETANKFMSDSFAQPGDPSPF